MSHVSPASLCPQKYARMVGDTSHLRFSYTRQAWVFGVGDIVVGCRIAMGYNAILGEH